MTDTPLHPARPHTATQLLVAQGGDPFERARESVLRAREAVDELLTVLPQDQQRLRERFTELTDSLRRGHGQLAHRQLSQAERSALALPTLPSWGERASAHEGPVGSRPPALRAEDEPVYGFADALEAVSRDLAGAAAHLSGSQAPAGGLHRVMRAGAMAEAATAAEHLTHVFTAAVWDFERPAMPPVPPDLGRVELRSAPRAAPQRRWARQARVIFTPGRVEILGADGSRVIGDSEPMAMAVHVAPAAPREVLMPYDPAERYRRTPCWDELGVLHFCSASGYSLGAIAVADWLAQPEYLLAQERAMLPGSEHLRARELLVRGLDVAGISAGLALLGVELRRGVLHPPSARSLESATMRRTRGQQARMPAGAVVHPGSEAPGSPGFDPPPVVDLIRPAPHLQPYRGLAARAAPAYKRRLRRHKRWRGDTGPASPVNLVLRAPASAAIVIAGLGGAYLLAETWFIRLCAVWAVLAVLEPWAWTALERLRDRRRWRPVALYRPGPSAGVSRAFATRAALVFDGRDIAVRGPGGHEAWLSGPGQPEPGVVAVQRLSDETGPWAVALAGRAGEWRVVLPLATWVPDGDLTGLAGFAREAGLSLSDVHAERLSASDDVFADGSASAAARSRGPASAGLLILAFWALVTAPLTLLGWRVATAGLLILAVAAVTPVLARWIRERRLARTFPP
ncbi:hypothetical protein LQF12_10580 [Ruania suaedae]|uniref:hypothetical protein n=1 Tax=Ruania suaedae TaxID=2897774 RepID=UPI001E29789D|nr:hypothetical protein [Ruania suaedae]UFU01960.1 hypothetical protein LQF12_10580 [Ruania suaedae]